MVRHDDKMYIVMGKERAVSGISVRQGKKARHDDEQQMFFTVGPTCTQRY